MVKRAALNCGNPPMAFGLGLRRDPAGGVPSLFTGRRVSYSFNTRVAIRKAVDLLGLKPGDEVLAPAYNCGSELDPLRHAGLNVRLYPVTDTAEIDPDQLSRMIGPHTRALYLTHYFGFLQPETDAVRTLCNTHGLRLIEDCALSLLSGDAPAEGRAGDISVFCFYKFFPVLAGGALVINDDHIAAPTSLAHHAPITVASKHILRAGLGMALGADRAAELMRRLKRNAGTEPVSPASSAITPPDMPGHYYFDPALQDTRIASITTRALSGFDVAAAIAARRTNYARLLDGLAGTPNLRAVYPDLPTATVPLSMPVRVKNCHRNALVKALQAEGIAAMPWWAGYNRHLDFSDRPGIDLSAARTLKDTIVSLPIHQYLGTVEIDHIAARLRQLSCHFT